MYIIASFKHSKEIEIALADIENYGLNKENILALPLDKRVSKTKSIAAEESFDRESLIDLSAIFGMIFMLLGSIYGFVLKWGPILCALIGLILGSTLGFLIKFLYIRGKRKKSITPSQTDIVMIIKCEKFQEDTLKDILWENSAIGLTTFN